MSAIVGMLVSAVLNWVASKIAALVAMFKRDKQNHDEAVAQATQDTAKAEAVTRDSTQEEVSRANDDTLSHF